MKGRAGAGAEGVGGGCCRCCWRRAWSRAASSQTSSLAGHALHPSRITWRALTSLPATSSRRAAACRARSREHEQSASSRTTRSRESSHQERRSRATAPQTDISRQSEAVVKPRARHD
eukprot:5480097-Pleurochrysis_carterae.AAC.6